MAATETPAQANVQSPAISLARNGVNLFSLFFKFFRELSRFQIENTTSSDSFEGNYAQVAM